MKKTAACVLAAGMISLLAAGSMSARVENDLQIIKKAVKNNPAYRPGMEVRWFKIQVRNMKTMKNEVQITLPIAVLNLFCSISKNKHLDVDCGDFELDFRELYRTLKRMGPRSLLEVRDHHKLIKIWLE